MEIEKEYRYKVTDEQIQRIKQISNVIDEKSEQIDLTLGKLDMDMIEQLL